MNTVTRLERGGMTRAVGVDEFMADVERLGETVVPPFSEAALGVLGALSKRLLTSAEARAAPQLVALGYWLRPAALTRMQRDADASQGTAVRVARGVAYQLPPKNVDTLFVYSWALSFLLGNANVTRLPGSTDRTVDWLVEQILDCLAAGAQEARQLFCSFDHRGDIGARLSRLSDLRVI